MTRAVVVPASVYGVLCAVLWPIPVFGLLHAESSAVVAGVAFGVSGLAAVSAFQRGEALGRVLVRHLALLAVPLAGLTLSLLWQDNCAYLTGLGLYLVLVPPSAVLGVALAYVVTGTSVRTPRTLVVAVGLVMAVGGVVWDLGFHPQLFTYNHVFGGVLGPIYDEELAVRPGLFVFRTLTLLLAAGAVLAGRALRAPGEARRFAIPGALVAVAVAGAYGLAVPLGFQQSHGGLVSALEGTSSPGRFEVYYDVDTLTPEALRRIEDELVFRYRQIAERLGVEPARPIRVYLYPDEAIKGALIGSRRTSVVPVWLAVPQIHMLADEVGRSAAHELVHVFAREFGMPGLRASPAVGLVEGLAVALEPPDGLPPPADVVRAALDADIAAGGLETDPAAVARATLDPVGFWTSRAGVAYTTSGAFVDWLLETRGSAPFRRAYRTGNVEAAYGESARALSESWAASVRERPVSPVAVAVARDLLTRRSLFERPCPHDVPRFAREARAGAFALDAGRPHAAAEAFARALRAEPRFEPAVVGWSTAVAARGGRVDGDSLRAVEARLDSLAGPDALTALADLHRLAGRDDEADRLYARALERTPSYAPLWRARTRSRSALSRRALRAAASTPWDPAGAAQTVGDRAPLEAAILLDAAERPAEAWRRAQRWDLGSLAATPTERAALANMQARLAYRAGALRAAGLRADTAAAQYRREGLDGAAAFADDWARRARWRHSLDSRRGPSPLNPR